MFEDGLAAHILDETGADPGALALLAYALDQLYRSSTDDGQLSFAEYRALGGVQKAIGKRADEAFNRLPPQAQAAFGMVFRELVEVDERGEPTRRRALLQPLAAEPGAQKLITVLTDERLLVTGRAEGGAVVEVAHEALLRTWDHLRMWLDGQVSDLQLRRRLEGDARRWANAERKTDYVLLGSRLEEAERWAKAFSAPQEVARFIDASTAQEVQRRAEEDRRKAELLKLTVAAEESQRLAEDKVSEAQQSADRADRQRRRARSAIIAALLLFVVAAAVSVLAFVQTNTANERIAELAAIAPGATRGAIWREWISGQSPEFWRNLFPSGSFNSVWSPVRHAFDDGVPMVLVPSGCFMMGSNDDWVDEQQGHEECFEEPFWIDLTEVTQFDFERLGGMKVSTNGFDGEQRPVEVITWFEARDFCVLRGARLPTEREWEYAARGPDNMSYPWGNDWNASNAVSSRNLSPGTDNVGSMLAGASWVGALDMSGNVQEWVSSLYLSYDSTEDREADTGTRIDVARVLRGGSWGDNYSSELQAGSRFSDNPDVRNDTYGFRCARDFSV